MILHEKLEVSHRQAKPARSAKDDFKSFRYRRTHDRAALPHFSVSGMNRTLQVYDQMVDDYVELVGESVPIELSKFIEAAVPGARILDLGCGPGHHAAHLARAGFDVLAVDGSAEMVARASRHRGVDAIQATFDDIPTLGRVGGIWASFSLLHAPRADLHRHLEALHEICEPGGPLSIGMKLGTGERIDRLGRHYSYYSEDELCSALIDAGFFPGQSRFGSGKGLSGDVEDWITMIAHA